MHDTVVGVLPPNANPAFCVPAPAKEVLDVIKAPPADHDVPLYSSVHARLGKSPPPNAKPAFCVPAPPEEFLSVIKEPPADHDVPLYSFVMPVHLPPPQASE